MQIVAALWDALVFLEEGVPVRVGLGEVELAVSPHDVALVVLDRVGVPVLVVSNTLSHRNMGAAFLKQACQNDVLVVRRLQTTLGRF